MKSCFMFGHRDTPPETQQKIISAVERLYLKHGVTEFYVGGYGAFDRLAGAAVKDVKRRFPEMMLYLLIPYHPAARQVALPGGYDGSFYPPLENVPQRYAIVKANQYMVNTCDAVICYVRRPGNSKVLLTRAQNRGMKEPLIIENIGM